MPTHHWNSPRVGIPGMAFEAGIHAASIPGHKRFSNCIAFSPLHSYAFNEQFSKLEEKAETKSA